MDLIPFFPTREAARTSAVRFRNAEPMLRRYDLCGRLLKKVQMSRDFAERRVKRGASTEGGSRRTSGTPQRVTENAPQMGLFQQTEGGS